MADSLLPFLGWTFLPDLVTGYVQSFYYSLTIRAGDPKPQPGSLAFAKHRRRIYIGVICSYLLYTLYEAHWNVRRQGDFYADLGVPHDVDEKALQSRFRRLTVLHHPDKINVDSPSRAVAEAYYVHLKLARDTLLDPAKRFAYDRFGPDIVRWQNCITIKEFVMTGLRGLAPFYVVSGLLMVVMGYLGFLDWGEYWRYLAFASLAVYELYALTRSHFPLVTQAPTLVNPFIESMPAFIRPNFMVSQRPYLPFQTRSIAHKAIVAFFIALQRIGPYLTDQSSASVGSEGTALEQQLRRLEKLVQVNAAETSRLLALEMVPFRANNEGLLSSDGGIERLKMKVKDWFVTNTIRSEKEVRDALERVLEKRKREAGLADPPGETDGTPDEDQE